MTTVAYDGKTIAVDSLVTGGFMHTTSKVFRLPDGSYGAGAGVLSAIQRFFRAFDGGTATIPKGGPTMYVDSNHEVTRFNSQQYP